MRVYFSDGTNDRTGIPNIETVDLGVTGREPPTQFSVTEIG